MMTFTHLRRQCEHDDTLAEQRAALHEARELMRTMAAREAAGRDSLDARANAVHDQLAHSRGAVPTAAPPPRAHAHTNTVTHPRICSCMTYICTHAHVNIRCACCPTLCKLVVVVVVAFHARVRRREPLTSLQTLVAKPLWPWARCGEMRG